VKSLFLVLFWLAILVFAGAAKADVQIIQLTDGTLQTVSGLGNKFVFGCGILAAAWVITALINRK
jgi:hypothetical protein